MSNLANQLGQIVFRIETHVEYLSRRIMDEGFYGPAIEKVFDDLHTDIERLKQLKIILDNP